MAETAEPGGGGEVGQVAWTRPYRGLWLLFLGQWDSHSGLLNRTVMMSMYSLKRSFRVKNGQRGEGGRRDTGEEATMIVLTGCASDLDQGVGVEVGEVGRLWICFEGGASAPADGQVCSLSISEDGCVICQNKKNSVRSRW